MLGGKSELGTPYYTGDNQGQYPFSHNPQSGFNSTANLPLDNPSTDHLLSLPGRGPFDGPSSRLGAHHAAPSTDSISGMPLLTHAQDTGRLNAVPYPPSAYTQPPIGYTPPTMRRTASDLSDGSQQNERSRWDAGSDMGVRSGFSAAPSYATVPQYDDPYGGRYGDPYQQDEQAAPRGYGQYRSRDDSSPGR